MDAAIALPARRVGAVNADADRELVERCRRGEPGAAESLVSRHAAAVHRVALRLLGDPEEARDLAQDTFLRAFRGLRSFRGDASIRTWLLRIAVNAARNRRRSWARSRRARTVSLDGPGESASLSDRLPDPAPDPGRRLEAADLGGRLRRALDELAPEFREAVILRDIEGLDYRRIAVVLGLRRGTVKSRISRGREMLRRKLEGRP